MYDEDMKIGNQLVDQPLTQDDDFSLTDAFKKLTDTPRGGNNLQHVEYPTTNNCEEQPVAKPQRKGWRFDLDDD